MCWPDIIPHASQEDAVATVVAKRVKIIHGCCHMSVIRALTFHCHRMVAITNRRTTIWERLGWGVILVQLNPKFFLGFMIINMNKISVFFFIILVMSCWRTHLYMEEDHENLNILNRILPTRYEPMRIAIPKFIHYPFY